MTKATAVVLVSVAALGIVLGSVLYGLKSETVDGLWFWVWRLTSSKAHGGQYVRVNGIRLYYETYGRGRPVLVLHGGTGALEDMHYQITALAAKRFVIAPDSRGHGLSSDSDVPLSYRLMADDMLTLLTLLKIDTVDIVGWSDGGIIGLELAIHHPERVRRLVVIGANYDVNGLTHPPIVADKPPRASWLYAHYAPDPAHWGILYSKVVTMWKTHPHYSLEELAKINAPTLVVAGEFDVVRREHTDQLAKAIPRATEFIVRGTTHFAPVEKPRVINAQILDFLDEQSP
jgi:pimeloyl-ACP methyl ester carboxylesterase